jgi:hypothetical protein
MSLQEVKNVETDSKLEQGFMKIKPLSKVVIMKFDRKSL